jgi:HEPN domain-containing protein
LSSAKVLFDKNSRYFDSAGYLSHLGIELVLKAMILNSSNEFPNEHSLAKLSTLIERSKLKLNYEKNHEHTLKMLDDFNELRYPNTLNQIEIGDDDWESIENLFEFLILKLPPEIQQMIKDINHTEKGNRLLLMQERAFNKKER